MNLYLQAIEALKNRLVKPSWFNSAQWRTIAPAIRQRSFFSATVNSAKVLDRMKNMLQNWQTLATETVINPTTFQTETVYKTNGMADFREKAADFLISEGVANPADFADKRISNPISNARLQLVFVTNTQQAARFAEYKARMSNHGWLQRNPAARFLRSPGAIIKRPLHVANEGEVRRWDDLAFWLEMNNADIGGFEVPWGPYGFNSYMYQQPVKREEAEKLGLVRKGEVINAPDLMQFGMELPKQLNHGLTATFEEIDPKLAEQARDEIRARFGPQAIDSKGNPTLDAFKQAREALRARTS